MRRALRPGATLALALAVIETTSTTAAAVSVCHCGPGAGPWRGAVGAAHAGHHHAATPTVAESPSGHGCHGDSAAHPVDASRKPATAPGALLPAVPAHEAAAQEKQAVLPGPGHPGADLAEKKAPCCDGSPGATPCGQGLGLRCCDLAPLGDQTPPSPLRAAASPGPASTPASGELLPRAPAPESTDRAFGLRWARPPPRSSPAQQHVVLLL
jgi:hypothetical protein